MNNTATFINYKQTYFALKEYCPEIKRDFMSLGFAPFYGCIDDRYRIHIYSIYEKCAYFSKVIPISLRGLICKDRVEEFTAITKQIQNIKQEAIEVTQFYLKNYQLITKLEKLYFRNYCSKYFYMATLDSLSGDMILKDPNPLSLDLNRRNIDGTNYLWISTPTELYPVTTYNLLYDKNTGFLYNNYKLLLRYNRKLENKEYSRIAPIF